MTRRPPPHTAALIAAGLGVVLLSLIVYWPVGQFDFVNYDDLEFVVENPHVATGLTTGNITWSFANAYAATGGPLTWISHMLDVDWFGMDAGAHHVTSLVLHICNGLLLLLVLARMTGAVARSACVAALFAVHPLHVESVAWVSQRKDVLSTLFWLLTMWAYVSYARRPDSRRYAAVLAFLIFGLMSKPMVATLPFVLLLLDVWPLERLRPDAERWNEVRRLTVEKLPLFLLAAGCMALTFAAQRNIGAVASFDNLPLGIRLSNAAVSYFVYVAKTIWPQGLVPYYPYPESLPIGIVVACAAGLVAITIGVILALRRAPYVTVGWFWYVGTLVPVIGVVQVGGHAMADRFTYVPLIGLFILVVWSAAALLERTGAGRPAMALTAALVVGACAAVARDQVLHWQNGVALWQHATRVSRDNARAHANLGVALDRAGQRDRAVAEYQEALRLDPRSAETHNNLGLAFADLHEPANALAHYREAVRLKPEYSNAHTNLANLLDEQGLTDEAIQHYGEAIRLQPGDVLARTNLAIALARVGRIDEAIAQLEEALRADPSYGPARRMLEEIRRRSATS